MSTTPQPDSNYNDCSTEQLAQALTNKVQASKRAHTQSVNLDSAVAKRLNTVAKDEKVLREELSLYRRLATIESEFETQLERLEMEKSALNCREADLRKKKG
jgi:hypothetical protein